MFWQWWQNLPLRINPIALEIGFFSIRWYSLMYLISFGAIFWLLLRRLKQEQRFQALLEKDDKPAEFLEHLVVWIIIGLFFGARLGYVIFYDPGYFLDHPWEIIWPFREGEFTGISGLSFHGGLLGILVAGWIFSRKYQKDWWQMAELTVPFFPLGIFLVRIGNFLNGELPGRLTSQPWGMHFPGSENVLRHPSQLYEALGEGLLLFLFLIWAKNKTWARGMLLALFLVGYGVTRFGIEFFRRPDPQLGFLFSGLTMGQILCLTMIIMGIALLVFKKKNSRSSRSILTRVF
jgi:phosphatidylglycerol:prolipoprotein diacylglycerol transferase